MKNMCEGLQRLAEVRSESGCAISFYLQPQQAQDRAHKREGIVLKEMMRDAVQGSNGNAARIRPDLDRIARLAESESTLSTGKVVFACAEKDIWQEFDAPPGLRESRIHIGESFVLSPLAGWNGHSAIIALIDRERARILELNDGALQERSTVADEVPRRVKTDGFGGFDAGHIERHADNEAMKHYKNVCERLLEMHTQEAFSSLVIGCRDESWPEIEPHLHAYLRQKLAGRFLCDPALVSAPQLLEQVNGMLDERRESEDQALVREIIGEAQRNARGSLGLKQVLGSLEKGEIQTLLIGRDFTAPAVECANCGHMDSRITEKCAACSQDARQLENVADALLSRALRANVEVRFTADEDFKGVGNIGALLRFRADQRTAEKLAG